MAESRVSQSATEALGGDSSDGATLVSQNAVTTLGGGTEGGTHASAAAVQALIGEASEFVYSSQAITQALAEKLPDYVSLSQATRLLLMEGAPKAPALNAPTFLYEDILGLDPYPAKLKSGDEFETFSPVSVKCSAVGIARPLRDGTLYVERSSNGVHWSEVAALSFTANRCAVTRFTETESTYWRVRFDAVTSFGALKLGPMFEMYHLNYAGVTPPYFAQESDRFPKQANTGQWFGRRSYARKTAQVYRTDRTPADWFRANALGFVEALRNGEATFYTWRPDKYPGDVMYGFLSGDIKVTNTGTRNFVSFDISLTGIADTGRP
nr:hypothetical protein 33 [bacterium]